jgi:hypothetical protein
VGNVNKDVGQGIDLRLGDICKRSVGCLFLFQRRMKNSGSVTAPELFCPRNQCTIASNFVVFDGLRCGDEGRIENLLIVNFTSDLIGFLNNSIDSWAVNGTALNAVHSNTRSVRRT